MCDHDGSELRHDAPSWHGTHAALRALEIYVMDKTNNTKTGGFYAGLTEVLWDFCFGVVTGMHVRVYVTASRWGGNICLNSRGGQGCDVIPKTHRPKYIDQWILEGIMLYARAASGM